MKRTIDELNTQEQQQQQNDDNNSKEEAAASPSQSNKRIRPTYPEIDYSPFSEVETGVGITEYISLNIVKPFYGILKHKVADFLVNEVDMDGNVVHLTDRSIPAEMKTGAKELSEEEKEEQQKMGLELFKQEGLMSEERLNELSVFLSQYSDAEQKLLAKNEKITVDDIPSLVLDAETEKTRRARMHEIVRNHFDHILISDTTPSPEGIRVRLRYNFTSNKLKNMLLNNCNNSKSAKQDRRRGKKGKKNQNKNAPGSLFDPRCNAWPKDRPQYLQFVLHKENCDTTNAMSTIAKNIHVKPNIFTWAGTKDKRGITAQLVTAFKLFPEKLAAVNSAPHTGIQVGNFKFVDHKLLLGRLRGNRFNLVIRKISQQDETNIDENITKALEAMQQTGFINYFGMQRFGMQDNPTHRLGQYVLKNDWENVVTKLLRSRCAKNYRLKEVIDQFYIDKDANAALQKLSCTNSAIEKALLSGYARSTVTDHSSAFGRLPRNLKTMFIHAYQSYVWNHMVSERVRKYGYKPVVGDLVMVDANDDQSFEDNDGEIDIKEEVEEEPATSSSTSGEAAADGDESSSIAAKKRGEPKVLTEQDLPNFTIEDVVMTVPGGSVIYPQNDINEETYFNFMSKDGIERVHFTRYQEENGSYGAYRHIIARAKDLTWKIAHHDNFDQKLLLTDIDRMKKVELPETEGKHRSLVIGFTLPSSTYATMFMRELMKLPSVRDNEQQQHLSF